MSEATGVPAAPTKDLIRAAVLATSVLLCLLVVYATPLRGWLDTDGVDRVRIQVQSWGVWAPAVFLPVAALSIAIGIPRIFFAAVAGAAFGFAIGLPVAWAATVAGCYLAFVYGRRLGRGYVERKVGGQSRRFGRLLASLEHHGVAGNLLIRAAPVGNCLMSNLLMSISPISTRDFLLGTFLGVAPETIIYCLLGSSVQGQFAARIAGGVMLLVALSICYAVYTRQSRLARSIAAREGAS
jgi:uncharacterized membrane protein YdjX (TVP38/TMEM64 family)